MMARRELASALALLAIVGCSGSSVPTPVTLLEIHSVPTIAPNCDELTSWSVNVLETGENYTRACDEDMTLTVLQPYQQYTLEIDGYARTQTCWRGECVITPLPGLGLAECPNTVSHVCDDAGGS